MLKNVRELGLDLEKSLQEAVEKEIDDDIKGKDMVLEKGILELFNLDFLEDIKPDDLREEIMLNVEKAANEMNTQEQQAQIIMSNMRDDGPLIAIVQTLLSIPMIRTFFVNFNQHPDFPILTEISSVLTKALRQIKIH